jgi:hypothetical protein
MGLIEKGSVHCYTLRTQISSKRFADHAKKGGRNLWEKKIKSPYKYRKNNNAANDIERFNTLLISLKAFKSYTMVCIYGYEQPIICNLTLPSLVNVHPLVMGKNYNLNKHTNSTVFLLLTSDNVPNTKDSHFSLYSSEVSETRDLNINGSYRKRFELSVHIVNLWGKITNNRLFISIYTDHCITFECLQGYQ